MAQKKQKPLSIGEALARPVTSKPAVSIDDALKRPVTQPEDRGILSNLRTGAEEAIYEDIVPSALSGLEALGSAMTGDFGPAKEIGELALRGAGRLFYATPAGAAYAPANEFQISEVQRQQRQRRQGDPVYGAVEQVQQDVRREAERDPSLKGRVARGAGRLGVNAVPGVVAGVASGGSVPAVAAVAAAQSLGAPENMALNVGLSALPAPAIAPILRRIRGARGVATETADITAMPTVREFPPLPREAPPVSATREMPTGYFGEVQGPVQPTRLLPETVQANAPTATIPLPYRGERVTIQLENGAASGTSNGTVFGKVRVKLEDGRTILAEPGQLTSQSTPSGALRSAYAKLGTSNPDEIGDLIQASNRRYVKSLSEAEQQQARAALTRVSQLTAEENAALGQVLPARPYNPAMANFTGRVDYARNITDIPAAQPDAQLDANLRELEDFFSAASREAQASGAANVNGLARAVGQSADDVSSVSVAELGLESKTPPMRLPSAEPRPASISIDDIAIGQDSLSRGRMFQAAQRGAPIEVVPDPQAPGKWLAEAEGNHSAALLKLQGYSGEIPVIAWETPAQAATAKAATRIRSSLKLEGELVQPRFGVRAGKEPAYKETLGPSLDDIAPLNVGGGGGRGATGGTGGGASPANTVTPDERASFLETMSALRKAGLLTSLKTHFRNLGGSAGFQLFDEVAKIPGAIVDIAISRISKQRTLTGPNLAAIARSAKEAATRGVDEAKQILRTGKAPDDINELAEIAVRQFPGSTLLQGYINGVFRTLKAEDRLFRVYAFRRSLEDRARATALTEMRQGKITRGDVGRRQMEIVKQPPADLEAAALLDAEVATFNNSNLASQGREAVRGVLQRNAAGKVADFAIDQVVPFVKTPSNIIARMFEASPLGFGKNLGQLVNAAVKKSWTAEQQRAFSQTFGRASAGSALLAIGYIGHRDGWITGMIENDLTKRARDLAAGRMPGSMKLGDTWYQLTGFAPLGNLIALGATLARETEQEQESSATAAARVLGDVATEQPFLVGVEQFKKALEQPGTAGERFAGGYLGSFVPSAVADVADAADSAQRVAEGLTGRAQSRIPGLRGDLPVAQDVLGQPRQDMGPIQAFADPTRAQTDAASENPLFSELVRLDQGISSFSKRPGETPAQYRTRQQTFGRNYLQYGAALVSNPKFRSAPDSTKRLALTALNDRAMRTVALANPLPPQALNPEVIMAIASQAAIAARLKKTPARK